MRAPTARARRLWQASACLLALAACEAEPVVVVGKTRHQAGNAGERSGSAGSNVGGDEDGDHDRGDFDARDCTADEPVCGVDGVTYTNRCEATTAGVQVARRGSC
jgi:hypothetical protein